MRCVTWAEQVTSRRRQRHSGVEPLNCWTLTRPINCIRHRTSLTRYDSTAVAWASCSRTCLSEQQSRQVWRPPYSDVGLLVSQLTFFVVVHSAFSYRHICDSLYKNVHLKNATHCVRLSVRDRNLLTNEDDVCQSYDLTFVNNTLQWSY